MDLLIKRCNKCINDYDNIKYSYTNENLVLKLCNMINVVKIFKEIIEKYNDNEIELHIIKMLKIDYDELQYDLFTIITILEHNIKKTPRRQRKRDFIKRKYFFYNFNEEIEEMKKEIKNDLKEDIKQKFEKKQEIKKEIKIDKNNINSIKISSSDDKELFLYI